MKMIITGVEKWDFLQIYRMNGCGEACPGTKHHLSTTDILRSHEHFTSLPVLARKQWILDYLIMHSSEQSEQMEIALMISGKVVCLPVWIATLGFSKSHYYGVRQLFLQGCKRIVSHIHRHPTQKTNEAVAWLDNFVTLMGDKMPDRATIHLPSCFSKLSVYQRLVQEFKDRGKGQIICQSQFFEVWKTHFHHVSIPKVV